MAQTVRPDAGSAPDLTTAFFEQVAVRDHDPLLTRGRGSLRFDLVDGEEVHHWRVTMADGDVTVSSSDAPADCVARMDRAMFEDFVTGRANAMARFLRGQLVAEGDGGLLLLFQRLFPGPTQAPQQRTTS